MLNGTFTWNGTSTVDLGIKVERFPAMNRPTRKYQRISVPGRNGDLFLYENAWNNYDQEYEIYAAKTDPDTLGEKWTEIMEWLMPPLSNLTDGLYLANMEYGGYRQLTDTYDPGIIRLASYVYETGIGNTWNKYGKATVKFSCRPERFLADAFTPIALSETGAGPNYYITNPTINVAKPFIHILYSTASYDPDTYVLFNGKKIVFPAAYDQVIVDCERMDILDVLGNNLNGVITLPDGWPQLSPGSNTITWTGYIEDVNVYPRWWRI